MNICTQISHRIPLLCVLAFILLRLTGVFNQLKHKEIFVKVVRIVLIAVICIFPALAIAGKAYYVDPSQSNPYQDGSYAHPWNSLLDVNNHKFNSGDDVYFKVGTTLKAAAQLIIDWDGTPNDRVIIGAYYGLNKFGLGGKARPVIDGHFTHPKDVNSALVLYTNGAGYVTVSDLQIINAKGTGISLSYNHSTVQNFTKHNIVRNCYVKRSKRVGILFARASYGLIENSTVEQASYGYSPGASIVISGMNDESLSLHNTVRGCTVFNGFEGIGVYKGARYTTVENNTIYNCRSFHLYLANARDAVFRNNVIYETASRLPGDSRDKLIVVDAEGHVGSIIKVTGSCKIYNNYLAGGLVGISLLSNANNVGVYQSNNEIYNNRIIDCTNNFEFNQVDPKWRNNKIYGNYSFIYTKGLNHANNYLPSGVTWTANYFNSAVSGNAATNAHINKVWLSKNSGWQTLNPGSVTTALFNFTSVPSSGTPTILPPSLRIESSSH